MIAFLFFLVFLLVYMVFAVYAERKLSAFIQDRLGPTEIGPYGMFQTLADLVKLLQKEDIVPVKADKWVFLAAPAVIFTAIFAGFAVMPLTPTLQGSGAVVGVFYLLTIVSIDIVGLLAAGWSSNNKYSLLGAMRSVAQIVSYEIPVGLSVLCVVVLCQTLDLQEICYQQGIYIRTLPVYSESTNYLFGIKRLGIDMTEVGGFLTWNVIRMPLFFIVYIIFFIATLAEANRAPFDIPEAESELVGGFHTEYSGFRWALLFLAEYGMMLLVSFLGAVLFFGGWNTLFPNIGPVRLADWTSGMPGTIYGNITGAFWIILKAFIGVFIQMWVRWTYPRLRVDQLMHLCWKVLTPLSLLLLFISALWKLL
ncbi:NADH-quinone oxidoreductase subunit H [Cytophagaceae bacterium DM2B3-1]|uniref:NADH-quinone oxidoreductase subunit H n=1 Tax=Xanthocytophaga flava TaxID=3048013 RepID=A0AAE3QMQ1_9BACT|nr:complex I subunit 1 family protein [Xanthocytophaga flavus]MDJ1471618.1 NADH-quinone oxidoreductase subunit H [Xanthocytophaga flavus]MDJ1482187.1 NADH-quinone oxidoreductase subunit H [Xanthocytophaga flavus]MDJ1491738.1 NADH-quinone oxidoreductase subunit H [Xanthocytophaga flavus]